MEAFRIEQPQLLWTLLLLPTVGLLLLYWWRYRQRMLARLAHPAALTQLLPDLPTAGYYLRRAWLLSGVLLALGVALSNPQLGVRETSVKRTGIDLFVALDISRSMLAADFPPNRLERAKRLTASLVKELANHNIGLILFTCDAFVAVPLTTDYQFVQLALRTADPEQTDVQGTDLSSPLTRALASFPADSRHHRAILLISDGEGEGRAAVREAQKAREEGTFVFTVATGRPEGAYIPLLSGGGYLTDATGRPVRSVPDIQLLKEIASAGQGASYTLDTDTDALVKDLSARINAISKRSFESRTYADYESYFQWFIGLALLLLAVDWYVAAGAWPRKA
jgi:Ca-activated chloride channel homolog